MCEAGPGIILKRPGASSVKGRVFHDKDANGIYEVGIDEPINNFRVFLDKDFDGVQDADEPGKQVSSAGTYTFTNVVPEAGGVAAITRW